MTVRRTTRELGLELHTTTEGVSTVEIRSDSGEDFTDVVLPLLGDILPTPDATVTALALKEPVRTMGTAAPTTGAHARGDLVWNSAPSAAGYTGWICVTAGTPGTWKGFGVIES